MAEIHVIEGNDTDKAREIKSSLLSEANSVEETDCLQDEGRGLYEAVSSVSMFGDRRFVSVVNFDKLSDEWAKKIVSVDSDTFVVAVCTKVPASLWKVVSKCAKKHDANTSKTTIGSRVSVIAQQTGVQLDRESVALLSLMGTDGLIRVRNVCWQLSMVGIKKPSLRQVQTLVGDLKQDGVPWSVTDAMERNDVSGALKSEVEVFPLISYLYNEYARAARVLEDGHTTLDSIQNGLGCTPFQAKKALERSKKLGIAKIYRAIDSIAAAELRAKDGTGPEEAKTLLITEISSIERQ